MEVMFDGGSQESQLVNGLSSHNGTLPLERQQEYWQVLQERLRRLLGAIIHGVFIPYLKNAELHN